MKGIFAKKPYIARVSVYTECFSLQYAEDPGIRYSKFNAETGYIDDTYFRRSEGLNIHSIRVSDIKILDIKVFIPITPLIKHTKAAKHIAPL